ncbi:MAG: IS21 family transposase [Actinobacteria bacterium]|nr:IS21 family transposase [Actinomycetota bacterium]
MLAQEEHVEAKALKGQGWSISAIARHLGRDRKTIRASLREGRTPDGRARSTDPFARFVPYATQRLKEDPHLRLSVLLRELQALGFASSYQTLTREVRDRGLRPHCEACAGVKGRATIDIPHDPGHETQWDWLEFTETPWGQTAYVQVGALAHSGKFRGSFQPAKDSGHLIAAMQAVIPGLGGLTKRFRIDAMEGAVVPGTRRLNASFADFCRSLGVGVDMCPPRRGNRKGVVENSNNYLAQSWWRTADVATPEQAQASLDAFCARIADARPRGDATAGALAASEPLRPVPRTPYPVEVSESRGVSWGALVSVDGNRYSVPPAFVDSTVMVHWRVGDPGFEIRSITGEVLARHHRRPPGAGAAVRLPEHKAALEQAVLAAFTTERPCRRKQNRPPSEAARALASELLRPEQQSLPMVVDLRQYEELMRRDA